MVQVSKVLPAHAKIMKWPGAFSQNLLRNAQGLQFETVNLGPPKPPCNEARLATLKALECTDGPSDPELGERSLNACCLCAIELPTAGLH